MAAVKHVLRFSPLLLLYICLIVSIASGTFIEDDEDRYAMFATNLSHGFYSPKEEVILWNGPGYPIVLLPFVLLELPWPAAKYINALFLFLAIVYFYHTLRLYISHREALCFSYLLGIYPPFMRHLHLLFTETFVFLLICGFVYHFARTHQDYRNSRAHLAIASVYLGYLALTKIFYGYVILSGLVLFLVLYLWKRTPLFKKTFLVYVFGLLLCAPYLIYTYSLTGRIFYWGNAGGISLYWMSSPYPNDLGDWHPVSHVYEKPELAVNHRPFFDQVLKLPNIERDDAFKKRAVQNILQHPAKFAKNWIANVGRILFSYPFSYTPQKLSTYFYMLPNTFLVVFLVLSIYPAYRRRSSVPYEIRALLAFATISFAGTSLLSAYNRLFQPLVPIVALWVIFIFLRLLKVELQAEGETRAGLGEA